MSGNEMNGKYGENWAWESEGNRGFTRDDSRAETRVKWGGFGEVEI